MHDVPFASRALPRILIVEAHDDMRRMQARFLSRTFAVDVAATGEEALKMALGHPYAAVVIDAHLQGRPSGVEVMQRLKATPQHRRTAMVATSGPLPPPERDALIHTGFDFYLAKPFRWQVLLDVVRHAVAQTLGQPNPPASPVAPAAVEPSAVDAPMDPSLARLVDQLSRDVTPSGANPKAAPPESPPAEPRSTYAPPENRNGEALAVPDAQASPALPDRAGWTSLGDL
ncbi:MAG: response regulator [Bacteroidetes bacterium]|nr:response regulator [Bacteroidota bacterium]